MIKLKLPHQRGQFSGSTEDEYRTLNDFHPFTLTGFHLTFSRHISCISFSIKSSIQHLKKIREHSGFFVKEIFRF